MMFLTTTNVSEETIASVFTPQTVISSKPFYNAFLMFGYILL